jgi:hypothetical protein
VQGLDAWTDIAKSPLELPLRALQRNRTAGTGILTRCPSRTPFGLCLGPTNPGATIVAQETLLFRCAGFSPAYVTHSNILACERSTTPYSAASLQITMLLYHCNEGQPKVFPHRPVGKAESLRDQAGLLLFLKERRTPFGVPHYNSQLRCYA